MPIKVRPSESRSAPTIQRRIFGGGSPGAGGLPVRGGRGGGGGGGGAGKGKGGGGGGGIGSQSITSRMLDLTISTVRVADSETTTSTSYTDLATSGPAVTITPGVTQDHWIMFGSGLDHSGTNWAFTNVAVAGGAPNSLYDQHHNGTIAVRNGSAQIHAAAQTSGATHTQKYVTDSGTATFFHRRVTGVAL